jgi:hypothetical protein
MCTRDTLRRAFRLKTTIIALLLLSIARARATSSSSSSSNLQTVEQRVLRILEQLQPSSQGKQTHTGDGIPTTEIVRTEDGSLRPATLLNGKHVSFSKRRVLEELGNKMEARSEVMRELARSGFDSISMFGAENYLKPIENEENAEGTSSSQLFSLIEFREFGKSANEEEDEENDIHGGERVAVFNVDMASDMGRLFTHSKAFEKFKNLHQKDGSGQMSIQDLLAILEEKMTNEELGDSDARFQRMEMFKGPTSFVDGVMDSDMSFNDEEFKAHRRSRGIKVETDADRTNFKSGQGRRAVRAEFYNSLESHVELAWLDFEGKEVKYAELAPGASTTLSTFTLHKWIAKDYIGDPICLFSVEELEVGTAKQYFEISEEEEVTLVREQENEDSHSYIKRKDGALNLNNIKIVNGDDLTPMQRREILKVAEEQVKQLLAKEKSGDEDEKSMENMADFLRKRLENSKKDDGGKKKNKEEEEEDKDNLIWLSEEQFRELGFPDGAKIRPRTSKDEEEERKILANRIIEKALEEEIQEQEALIEVLEEQERRRRQLNGEP